MPFDAGIEGPVRLPGRNSVRRRVDEQVALAEVPAGVAALFRRLAGLDEFEVLHGGQQTVLNYRGQGIGGMDRVGVHGYLSKALVVGSARDAVRRLGFQYERMRTTGTAYREHSWWQVDLVSGLEVFEAGLLEVKSVVDAVLDADSRST